MAKRRSYPSNGPESSAQEPARRGDEIPPASTSPDHQNKVEQMTPDDPSTQEEDGGSEALMESYNG